METNSSDFAWSSVWGKKKAKASWSREWKRKHINVKELEAVLQVMKTFNKKIRGKRIGIKVDNQVALSYINRMTKIARKIVKIAVSVGTTVIAMYIPSEENKKTNSISRLKDIHN
jgi:hypothetical protein